MFKRIKTLCFILALKSRNKSRSRGLNLRAAATEKKKKNRTVRTNYFVDLPFPSGRMLAMVALRMNPFSFEKKSTWFRLQSYSCSPPFAICLLVWISLIIDASTRIPGVAAGQWCRIHEWRWQSTIVSQYLSWNSLQNKYSHCQGCYPENRGYDVMERHGSSGSHFDARKSQYG